MSRDIVPKNSRCASNCLFTRVETDLGTCLSYSPTGVTILRGVN